MKISGKMMMCAGGGLFLTLLLLGGISYIGPGDIVPTDQVVAGKYRLTSLQDGELMNFEGSVYFEFARQQAGRQATPVFKLHFINPETGKGSAFGFLIPLTPDHPEIAEEQYRVQADEKGFLNESETVFGYADMMDGNPALYFTESGSISISNSSTKEVAGDMNMLLKDQSGRSMRLKGRFNARPLYARQVY